MDSRVDNKSEPSIEDLDDLESVVVRFAGDSGDGMQLTGSQFTTSTALAGHDLAQSSLQQVTADDGPP